MFDVPARVLGPYVTIEPGAQTAWYARALSDTLVVTAGCSWVQRCGGSVEEIRSADMITILPGENCWHGAAPST